MFALSFVLLGTVFALQGVGVIQSPEPAEAKQKPISAGGLRCDEPVWNFGAVDSVSNPRQTHEFVLVNESKETVSIKKVHSSCGCMVADDYDKELPPGGSAKLRVNLQLPTVPQPFGKDLAVETNKGVLPLGVVGRVTANSGLYSIPARVNFGEVRREEVKERIVRLVRYDLSPIQSLELRCPEYIEYAVERPIGTGGVVVKLRFTPDSIVSTGRFEEFIVVCSMDGLALDLYVPVFAVVQESDAID